MNLEEQEQPGGRVLGLDAVLTELARNLAAAEIPPREHTWSAAEAYGRSRGEAGADCADVAREVLDGVHAAMADLAASDSSEGLLGRVRDLGNEAAVRAIAGWEQQRRDRREQWLSFLVHDLKNPLNTVLNAVWLVRGKLAGREDIDKLLKMVERAAHKIESGLGDVRDLERRHVAAPPKRAHP